MVSSSLFWTAFTVFLNDDIDTGGSFAICYEICDLIETSGKSICGYESSRKSILYSIAAPVSPLTRSAKCISLRFLKLELLILGPQEIYFYAVMLDYELGQSSTTTFYFTKLNLGWNLRLGTILRDRSEPARLCADKHLRNVYFLLLLSIFVSTGSFRVFVNKSMLLAKENPRGVNWVWTIGYWSS